MGRTQGQSGTVSLNHTVQENEGLPGSKLNEQNVLTGGSRVMFKSLHGRKQKGFSHNDLNACLQRDVL